MTPTSSSTATANIGPRSSLTTLQGIGIVLAQQRSDLVFSRDAGDPGVHHDRVVQAGRHLNSQALGRLTG